MSKYRKITITFRDEDALRQAITDVCDARSLHFEEAPDRTNALHLYGYQGDQREEQAQFVIRRQYVGSAANDIGFAKQADGTYELLISEFDLSQDRRSWLTSAITQRYAYHNVMSLAFQQGYLVTETALPDGTVQLELNRAY